MIAIVDYGCGNLQAIVNIYKKLNVEVTVAAKPAQLAGADRVILPGVGAFDRAMSRLNESGMREACDDAVLARKRPVLGICVGMQLMARRSDEGVLPGLGWIEGEVLKFDGAKLGPGMQLPHMGWNDVAPRQTHTLLRGLETGARFYFLHSYYFAPRDDANVLAVTDYGGPFACGVHAGNVYGVQFHPEKSHQWGIQLLRNFAELAV